MKKLLSLLLLAGLAACGAPADQSATGKPAGAPKKDAPAPPLVLENFVSGDLKAVKGWEDLKGKAVVLEFWATFCDPCVENIPHMNELVESFKDKPVVFISLTRDSRGEIEKFMKTHPMMGNVAVEAAGAFRNFKVRGIPHTVLVDKAGVIRAFSYPSMVTPATIEALLAGSAVIPGSFVEKSEAKAEEPAEDTAAATAAPAAGAPDMAAFSIVPVTGGGRTRTNTGDTEFTSEGNSLAAAITKLLSDAQLVEFKGVDQRLLDSKYNITCKVARMGGSDNRARLRELAVAGLSGAFPLRIRTERGTRKVLLLKKISGAAGPEAAKARGDLNYSTGDRGIEVSTTGGELADLRKLLRDWLKTPVLDESGLSGLRAYKFEASSRDLKAINGELKALGLRLEETRREIEIAAVTGLQPVKNN